MTPAAHTSFLTTDDGVRLALHQLGDGGTRVLLVAGTFSNHTFWLGTRGIGFARHLAGEGYETWTLDPRGHGASQQPARGQRWDFDDWARHDVATAIRAAAGPALFVIGHSAGGAATLAALAAEPALREHVRGVIILATPLPWLQRWQGLVARTLRAATRVLPRFPSRLLRLGPEDELPGVMAQWMTWNLSGEWVGDDGTDYGRLLQSLELPALFVAGAGDHLWAPPHACHGLFQLVGSPAKSFLLCGTHSGFSRDFGHVDLVVSRPAREEVWPLLANWLRGELGRKPRCATHAPG